MSIEPSIHINLNIDPTTMTATQLGEYAAAAYATFTTELATSAGTVAAGSPANVASIDKQLDRLTDFNPVIAPRVRALHSELVGLGYHPRLPNSERETPPAYISYVDPVTGNNLGNPNSERFTFMRGALRDKLKDKAHVDVNSRHASCHLVSDDALQVVVKVAGEELTAMP